MCDKLVYDLAQEVEGSPSVFIRKDWINILDNQNQSYIANQSVLDTSQLSNSNKWMSYREAYFSVPLTITMATQNQTVSGATAVGGATVPADGVNLFTPEVSGFSADSAIGLKNWYGNIIHSFTLDYNGTTIIQQTPFVNMWNTFKLMTSLSYQDILTQGCTIGFYPDDCETWEMYQSTGSDATIVTSRLSTPAAPAANALQIQYIPGTGVCNNTNMKTLDTKLTSTFQQFKSGCGNDGFIERCKWISFDRSGVAGRNASAALYGNLLGGGSANALDASSSLRNLWKGYIFQKQNQTVSAFNQTAAGVLQYSIVATIYLKHIHSFFNMIPLLKGAFMKMTMNLNNVSCTVLCGSSVNAAGVGAQVVSTDFQVCSRVQSALGGSNMLMLASNNIAVPAGTGVAGPGALLAANIPQQINGSGNLNLLQQITTNAAGFASVSKPYLLNLSVGSTCLDATLTNIAGVIGAPLSRSIYLYIPAYTFNPTFEQAYLSSPVKQIKYTDIYQYQVLSIDGSNGQINNLLTNGISNVKSVLVLPFYSPRGDATLPLVGAGGVSLSQNTGFTAGQPVWASPFDTAGCGTTSPLSHLTNFNVQVSGQNAIYNLQKYNFEQFNNQLYGQNAVNGGLTDGITSSLISRQEFDLAYCYYYVNIERMLPVEQSVPKSIQLIGTNQSSKSMDYICFIEYGTEVSIDALTGSRV